MTSGWSVPAGLRLLLDDIIHAVLDNVAGITKQLETRRIYRLIADLLYCWVDQRKQLELVTARQRKKSSKIQTNENKDVIEAAGDGLCICFSLK